VGDKSENQNLGDRKVGTWVGWNKSLEVIEGNLKT